MDIRSPLQRPALALTMGRLFAFGVTFFVPIVLVRLFDQAHFGTYKQLFVLYGTLSSLAQLGMVQSLYYFLPREPGNAGKRVVNSVLVLAASGLLCLGLLIHSGWKVSKWLNNEELSRYLPALGLYLLLLLTSMVLEVVMISRKQYLLAALSYFFSEVLRAALFILPVWLGRELQWLLWGGVIFALARVGFAVYYLRQEYRSELRLDCVLLRSQLAYAVPFQIYVLADTVYSNLHHYFVSHTFDASTFAIYAVGCLQIPLVDFVATPLGDIMMVNMSEAIRNDHSRAVLELWRKTTLKLAMVFIPLLSLLLLTSRELIVFLFTTRYLASVPIFMIWSTTALLAVLQTDAVLRVYAETRFLVLQNVLRIVLIGALISSFLSTFGLMGGVLITILATLVAKGLALVRMCRLMECGFRQLVPWRRLAVISALAILAGIPAILMKWELRLSPLPALLTTTLLYAASYAFLLFHLGPLSNEERLRVSRWLRNDAAARVKSQEYHIDRKETEHNDATRKRRTVEGRGRVLHGSSG